MPFEWGSAVWTKQGQTVSGDRFVVHERDEHHLVVAVIDGLGGGEEAARAAEAAVAVIQEYPTLPMEELMKLAHGALRSTRGAVMELMCLDAVSRKAEFMGVGNIGVHVYSDQPIKPISKNGIIGYRLPQLLYQVYDYKPGDLFVLYSDGISSRFNGDARFNRSLTPQSLADGILAAHGKPIDDATILVVRENG